MPHPIVFKGSQIGLQSALNSSAAAAIKLLAPGFSRLSAKAEGGYMHTNTGSRLPTATVPPGYFESEVTYEGPMDFICMLYLLASYFGLPTPTPDGTSGFAWDFYLGLSSGIERTFYTYENGDADRAESAINMFANSLKIESSKATQKYSGNLIAGKKVRGITLTGAPVEVAPIIIAPQAFDLYVASTKAALDTAVSTDDKVLTPFPLMVGLDFPEVADRLPRMNSDENSYAAVMDKAGTPTLTLKTTDEDDFDALADIIDTGGKQFFALRALGAVIAGGTPSQFQWRADFCGSLIEPETPEEEKSAAANSLVYQNLYDSTWGKAHNIRVVTTLDELD